MKDQPKRIPTGIDPVEVRFKQMEYEEEKRKKQEKEDAEKRKQFQEGERRRRSNARNWFKNLLQQKANKKKERQEAEEKNTQQMLNLVNQRMGPTFHATPDDLPERKIHHLHYRHRAQK